MSSPADCWRFLAVLLLLAAGAAVRAETVAELRALPFEAVQAGRSVSLTGGGVYVRDIPDDCNFSLHDGTGGVMVYPADRPLLRPGQRVSVRGITAMSVHGLRIERAEIQAGETGPLPDPLPTTMAAVRDGRHEGQYVEVEGLIRAVRMESPEVQPQRLALDFGPRAQRFTVWISHHPGGPQQFSPGQRVRCRGVAIRWMNPRGQPQSVNILANHEGDVTTTAAAIAPPLRPIREVHASHEPDEHAAPIRIRGVATLAESQEGWLVLQDGTQAVRVRPSAPVPTASVGQSLEASGFPVLGHYTTELEDAVLRPVEPLPAIAPESFPDADAVLSPEGLLDRDARLIRLPSAVSDLRRGDTHWLFECRSGSRRFTARLPLSATLTDAVRPGSTVLLTGICSLVLTDDRRRLARLADTFMIEMRSPDDVQVLAAGPWWTPERLRHALVLTAALAALLVIWSVSLRTGNTRLRHALLAQARAEQALSAERRRVADELHDTLQQTLTAASLQLHAAARLMPPEADAAAAAVRTAHELTVRSREEVRAAVWDLRVDDRASVHLGTLLRRLVDEMQGRASYSEDAPLTLPAHIAGQVVRICREALTNAVKHARQARISVALAHEADAWTLRIRDDGPGFEPDTGTGSESGRFGLRTMRERAARLGGTLAIVSRPGEGTEVRLTLPSAPEDSSGPVSLTA